MLNNGTEFEHALREGAIPKGTVLVTIKKRGFSVSNELN